MKNVVGRFEVGQKYIFKGKLPADKVKTPVYFTAGELCTVLRVYYMGEVDLQLNNEYGVRQWIEVEDFDKYFRPQKVDN